METTQSDSDMKPSVPSALPSIDEMIKTPLPETCESSASTVPPPSIPNDEATSHTPLEIPPVSLLSSLPVIHQNPRSHNNASKEPASSQPPPSNFKQSHRTSKEGNAAQPTQVSPVQKVQKRKRRAPQQPRNTKQPRLGRCQVNLKQRPKAKGRKNQNAKEKQAATSTKALVQNNLVTIQNSEKSNIIRKNVGSCGNKDGSRGNEASNDGVMSQTKHTISDNAEVIPAQRSCSQPSAENVKPSSGQSHEKASLKEHQGSKQCEELGIPVREGQQPTVRNRDSKQEEIDNAAKIADNEADEVGSGDRPDPTLEGAKDENKRNSERVEATLEEKYEDLSRRYLGLIGGMLKSSKRNSNEESDTENDGGNNGRSLIIDRKVYDTIYLCKTAQMLGALNIDGGAHKYVRPRIEGFDNPYERIVIDGFKFVEDLMIMGEPEDSLKSVSTVFHDLHIRLLMDIWKKYRVEDGGKVVGLILKAMIEQLKKWFTMIIDNKIGIRWCAAITEEFLEVLLRKLSDMGEKHMTTVVKTLRGVLKEISEFYQEAEKDITKACITKFCNSCEVSVCIARAAPEAALSLDVDDIFAIGRHNGVFAHCVARLQAERDVEEGD